MEKERQKEKLRDNPWKFSTIVLIILIIAIISINYYEKINNEKKLDNICKKIQGTPSWVNDEGNIIGNGFNSFGNKSWNVVERLIKNKIYFVYHPSCSYCQKQIEYFGNTWNDYVESGFTINCQEELLKGG